MTRPPRPLRAEMGTVTLLASRSEQFVGSASLSVFVPTCSRSAVWSFVPSPWSLVDSLRVQVLLIRPFPPSPNPAVHSNEPAGF